MREATFVGGPFDGDVHTIRSTVAVLAADESVGLVWKYVPQSDAPTDNTYVLAIDGDADPTTGARPYDEQMLINSVEAGMDVMTAYVDEPTQEQLDEEEVLTDGE